MCGTGDINVQDFKAHAVIVGGSWHFREKVSHGGFCLFYFMFQLVWACLSSVATGDEVVLGRGVQLHPGGVGSSAAVHHRLLSAAPGGIQHPLPLLPDHCRAHTQHATHRTHVVSKKTQADVWGAAPVMRWTQRDAILIFPTEKHRLDGLTGMLCWDVHGSHVGILLIFGERLTFPRGSSFLKEIQGQNQGWVISRDVGTHRLSC